MRRSIRSANNAEVKHNLKALTVATIAGLSIIGMGGQAQATTIDEVDLNQKPLDKPTLDYLHENNVQITDENGTETGVYPQSAYTLTKVAANADGTKPAGDNIITKFEYDKATGALTPVYYSVNLKQTEYGHKDATNQGVINFDNGITYYADKDRLATDDITEDQNGADIDKDFVARYNPAIENSGGTIGNITGDFVNKNCWSSTIYNRGIIGDIAGNFIKNNSSSWYGGAIYNDGTIGDITGNFISNYSNYYGGGAISNSQTIGNITANFIGNHTSPSDSDVFRAAGGAIYNAGRIGDITGDFIGNYALPSFPYAYDASGGAIYNSKFISNITGDFIGNHATLSNGDASGGAIYNSQYGTIGNITGDFIGNYAKTESGTAQGGAIYNQGNTNSIKLYYSKTTVTNSETGESYTFNGVYSYYGDVDYSSSLQDYIDKSNSEGYKVYFVKGNERYLTDAPDEWEENKKMVEEMITLGWATDENIIPETTVTINNPASLTITNSNFIGNHATSTDGEARGGAIYSSTDLNIIADGTTSVFKDNYTESNGVKDDNAIYIDDGATLNLIMKNGGKIYMADNIDGHGREERPASLEPKEDFLYNTYSVNIKGDDINNTTFYMLNDIRNANVTFDNTTINTVNNQVHVYNFNALRVNSDTNFVADVDLANEQMDRITASYYASHNGNLNVVGMNLLSDSTKDVTEIFFAEQGLKDNVVNGMPKTGEYNLPSTAQTTFYTPIYKYNAIYDNRDDGGYFMFAKGDKILTPDGNGGTTVTPSGNPSDAFNPSVLAPSVASQAGANATMNQTFNYAFQNSDNFMAIPYLERVSMKNANRYALSPTGDATDVGTFSPLFNPMNETSSAWVKPYASFENIPLKNGPKVSNITYGTLVGFDTPIKSIKNGWDRTWTGYIGYNGASQRYSGVDATQNGGLLGGTLTLYKGNFFNATTVSTGAIVGDARTMYGTDNYTMLMAGVGNKTGYNFEFKEGKLIIQPSMLLSYTFVNTFDYTNAAGVRMKNDPLHAIQIAPGVKFIANTKNGWQPYIGVNMVWNLLDKSRVSANDVRLPEMSIKPYIQYGVGVQKRFKDRYMAFGQAMIQNGGRNGISLTAGFRWAIGKEGKPLEKVQRVNNKTVGSADLKGKSTVAQAQPERKIIKQMSQSQRETIAKQYQNTTRTTTIGTLKQL